VSKRSTTLFQFLLAFIFLLKLTKYFNILDYLLVWKI